MAATVGEEGTEEDFQEYLDSLYRSREAYDRTNMANYINMQNFSESYGLKGEKVSDEQAIGYLEENGYVYANHILLATMDLTTGEALDEAAVAQKKAQAESLVEELKAIDDHEQLVERFKALKEEYCEDTGKTAYPDGYLFQTGDMVEEFESAALLLEEYGVSEPVESPYGYHIILRLPLDADAIVGYSTPARPSPPGSITPTTTMPRSWTPIWPPCRPSTPLASRPRSSATIWSEADRNSLYKRKVEKRLCAFFIKYKKMAVEKGLKII